MSGIRRSIRLAAIVLLAAPAAAHAGHTVDFTCSPSCGVTVGTTVTFSALTSAKAPVYAWDLDGDGAYDDAFGDTAMRTFTSAGTFAIGLEVSEKSDPKDVAAVRKDVVVEAKVPPPPPPPGPPPPPPPKPDPPAPPPPPAPDPPAPEPPAPPPPPQAWTTAGFTPFAPAAPLLLPPPTHPRVDLIGPQPGRLLNPRTAVASGTWSGAGIVGFCVDVDGSRYRAPAPCDQTAALQTDGTFSGVPIPPLSPGLHTIGVWLIDRYGQFARDDHDIWVERQQTGVDVRAQSIDITQGTQIPEPLAAVGPGSAIYRGVQFVAGRVTVVRVYANAVSAGDAPGGRVRNAKVVLKGTRTTGAPGHPAGQLFPSRLMPIAEPDALTAGPPAVSDAQRQGPRGAYTFILPGTWAHGHISLRAEVNPTDVLPAIEECERCRADNTFDVRGINFNVRERLTISPVEFVWDDASGQRVAPPRPEVTFGDTRVLVPDPLNILPYQDHIDVTWLVNARPSGSAADSGARQDTLHAAVAILRRNGIGSQGYSVGVSKGLVPGVAGPRPLAGVLDFVASVNSDRPRTSVAHEVWHLLGARHASNCTRDRSRSDPGVPLGLGAEGWPPDEAGYLQGFGLDPRLGSGGNAGPFFVIAAGAPGQPANWYDVMSYCASTGDTDSWISPRNWNRRLGGGDVRTRSVARAAPRAAGGPTLLVTATTAGERFEILGVQPGSGTPTPLPAGAAPFEVVVRDAGGAVVSRTPAAFHGLEGTGEPRAMLIAEVPAAGGARVEIVREGAVVASRARSAHAPVVRLPAPERVRGAGATTIRWQASDADGDTLFARLDYSHDDGRTWHALSQARGANQARVEKRWLPRSRRTRLRLTVEDGFNATTVVSGRVVTDGARPTVRIVSPAAGASRTGLAADAPLQLEGEAFDDAARTISGRALRWFDGKRALGRGARLLVTGLAPGRRAIRLVARDRFGRTATATVRVRVRAVMPRFVDLRAPRRIAAGARSLRIRLASTVPATLVAPGVRTRIGVRPRTVRIRVGGRARRARIALRLVAGGKSARTTIVVRRGR